jgi:hypothetical protein
MDAKPKRRWFRFSLRTLLVFITIASVGFGWLGYKVRQANRQRIAVQSLRDLQAAVLYDHVLGGSQAPPGPPWLRNLLGYDFFAKATYVRLFRADCEEEAMVYLRQLPHLENLDFGTRLTDSGLSNIRSLSNLQFLSLNNTEVTDAGLVHLRGLKIWSLRLDNTKITDAGLTHLKELTELREVFLRNTQISDAGYRDLQKLLPNVTVYRDP